MNIVEQADATRPLADYAAEIGSGPIVVTNHGQPVAALVPIGNADLKTIALSTNPKFFALIERSRERVRAEGGISSEDMRHRLD